MASRYQSLEEQDQEFLKRDSLRTQSKNLSQSRRIETVSRRWNRKLSSFFKDIFPIFWSRDKIIRFLTLEKVSKNMCFFKLGYHV